MPNTIYEYNFFLQILTDTYYRYGLSLIQEVLHSNSVSLSILERGPRASGKSALISGVVRRNTLVSNAQMFRLPMNITAQ